MTAGCGPADTPTAWHTPGAGATVGWGTHPGLVGRLYADPGSDSSPGMSGDGTRRGAGDDSVARPPGKQEIP